MAHFSNRKVGFTLAFRELTIIPLGNAPLLDVTIDSKGVFQKGKIHSFVQRQGKGPVLDPKHGAANDIDRLSKIDFPETRPNITPTGEITKR